MILMLLTLFFVWIIVDASAMFRRTNQEIAESEKGGIKVLAIFVLVIIAIVYLVTAHILNDKYTTILIAMNMASNIMFIGKVFKMIDDGCLIQKPHPLYLLTLALKVYIVYKLIMIM